MDRIDSAHPIRSARWMWPQGYMELHNHFAQFRRDVTLDAVPDRAVLAITADKNYRLWVNGAAVCRGPARGYQEHWPVDQIDLVPWLQVGTNRIAIEAYTPGISTFCYLHRSYAGVLCTLECAGQVVLASGDGQWQMRRSPGRRRDTARYSMQIDFQEHIDARQETRAWINGRESEAWVPDPDLSHGTGLEGMMAGNGTYWDFEERGIPLLRETLVVPRAAVAMLSGRSAVGYADARNVAWHWDAEARGRDDWQPAPATQQCDGRLEFTLEPCGHGGFHAVTVALPAYQVGAVDLMVTGAQGGEVIDVIHHERLIDGCRGELRAPGNGCWIALGNRMWLGAGRNQHEFFHPLGHSVLTVVVRDATAPLQIGIRERCVGYPFEMAGQFVTSDTELNDIHVACRRTQQLCSLDAYVDTPWREQAQWWGDARVQAANTFYLDGDPRLFARGIVSIADQPGPEGLTFGHAPTIAGNCVLPDFSLTWILTLRDHYWQTGSTALVEQHWERVQAVLGYFRRQIDDSPLGLIAYDPRYWLFLDWADMLRDEVPSLLNLWYQICLRELADLCVAAGMDAQAASIQAEASVHQTAVERYLIDAERGVVRPGVHRDTGAPVVMAPTVHDQCLGLMLDLPGVESDTILSEFIRPYLRGESVPGAAPSAFWAHYVFGLAQRYELAADVLTCIRQRWQPMLASGTCWEGFSWSEDDGGSACHAWSAHPCVHLVAIVAGVRQTAAQWRAVTIRPHFCPKVDHAAARVPTPQGPVEVTWDREADGIAVVVTVPQGCCAEVDVGDGVGGICEGTQKRWFVPGKKKNVF
ncbi:MAG: alpha-L-rhamnosidase [Planctomycetota bacterium]|jgi:alpha-L-rhamnosidase|nr:alpha-L-rhamnosidase [Planctomycetota bacterium]